MTTDDDHPMTTDDDHPMTTDDDYPMTTDDDYPMTTDDDYPMTTDDDDANVIDDVDHAVAAADRSGLTGNDRTKFLSGIASWAMDARTHTPGEVYFLADVAAGRAKPDEHTAWLVGVMDDMPEAPPIADYERWPPTAQTATP
jgi:hypothetical protein